MDEPISDASRAILDGHIVLTRQLAMMGHYPAIDVLGSVSRLKSEITNEEQKEAARKLIEILAYYKESEDMINIGAYKAGSNPKVDLAIKNIDAIKTFLKQNMTEFSSLEDSLKTLKRLAQLSGE